MAADVYSLEAIGVSSGQYVSNVMHFRNDDSTPSSTPSVDATVLILAWEAALRDLWLDMLPDTYTLRGVRARRVNNTGGHTIASLMVAQVGTRGPGSFSSVGPCILLPVTPAAGVFATGKIFLPGAADDDVVDNELSAGLITAIDAYATAAWANITSGALAFQQCVYQRVTETGFLFIATPRASLRIGSQRRRNIPAM